MTWVATQPTPPYAMSCVAGCSPGCASASASRPSARRRSPNGTARNWLSASTSALPFVLDYTGRVDFSDLASLRVRRDDTALDARFHLPAVLDWIDAGAGGSPLPPLQGTLRTPRIDIAGVKLEGVEIELDDPAIPSQSQPQP